MPPPDAFPTSSTQSPLPHINITTTYLQTTSTNGVETAFPSVITFESYAPIPATATVEITVLGPTGPKLLTVLTTYLPLPSTYLQQVDTVTSSNNATPACMSLPPETLPIVCC